MNTPSAPKGSYTRKDSHRCVKAEERVRSHKAGNPMPSVNLHRIGIACDRFFEKRGFKPSISEQLQTKGVVLGVSIWTKRGAMPATPAPAGTKRDRLDLSPSGCREIRKAVANAKANGLLTHAETLPTRTPIPTSQDSTQRVPEDGVTVSDTCEEGTAQGLASDLQDELNISTTNR